MSSSVADDVPETSSEDDEEIFPDDVENNNNNIKSTDYRGKPRQSKRKLRQCRHSCGCLGKIGPAELITSNAKSHELKRHLHLDCSPDCVIQKIKGVDWVFNQQETTKSLPIKKNSIKKRSAPSEPLESVELPETSSDLLKPPQTSWLDIHRIIAENISTGEELEVIQIPGDGACFYSSFIIATTPGLIAKRRIHQNVYNMESKCEVKSINIAEPKKRKRLKKAPDAEPDKSSAEEVSFTTARPAPLTPEEHQHIIAMKFRFISNLLLRRASPELELEEDTNRTSHGLQLESNSVLFKKLMKHSYWAPEAVYQVACDLAGRQLIFYEVVAEPEIAKHTKKDELIPMKIKVQPGHGLVQFTPKWQLNDVIGSRKELHELEVGIIELLYTPGTHAHFSILTTPSPTVS
jgi:hypothetical protein